MDRSISTEDLSKLLLGDLVVKICNLNFGTSRCQALELLLLMRLHEWLLGECLPIILFEATFALLMQKGLILIDSFFQELVALLECFGLEVRSGTFRVTPALLLLGLGDEILKTLHEVVLVFHEPS